MVDRLYHAEIAANLETAAFHLKSAAYHHAEAQNSFSKGCTAQAAYHTNLANEHVLNAKEYQEHASNISELAGGNVKNKKPNS